MRSLLLFLMVLVLTGCDKRTKVTVDKTDGYKGLAELNPYMAAQAFLREVHDGEVKVKNGFLKYDYDTGMVIAPASTVGSDVVVDKMLQWVSNGGVYVCLLERGGKHWVDVGESCDHDTDEWFKRRDDSDGVGTDPVNYLLGRLGVSLEDDPTGKTTGGKSYYGDPKHPVVLGDELPLVETVYVRDGDEKYELQIGGTKVVKRDGSSFYDSVSDGGDYHRFLGLDYGEGRIYFVTDGRLFRNPYLGMSDHAAMLERMSYDAYGDIVFSYGSRRGFWALMIHNAGPALLGVFVLLVFWLWKNIPRFGPLLEMPESHARDYLQSVRNTGRFLWKYKSSGVLLRSMRENVLRRSGMFGADGQVEGAMVETFSEKSGLDVEEVLEALTRDHVNEAGDMVRITKNLQTILKSL